MLSHARIIFRKLRGSGSRGSRGSEPAPSAPATIAESETVDPPPRAIHISDVRRSPTKLPCKRGVAGEQSMSIIVVNAKGAADCTRLYELLLRDKDPGSLFDPTDNGTTDYVCNGYIYNICFDEPSGLGSTSAYLELYQHICLVFTYASSRESWDEMVTAYERMRSQCKDRVPPFLATMIIAMGEGEGEAPVSHAEAEAFATQRDCLFVKVSPTTGRGICDAVSSLVELAYGARDQYTMDQKGKTQRYKRAVATSALFPPAQDWHHHEQM